MISVYAIGERGGRLTAFVKRGLGSAPAPEPEALLDHDRVVYSLMDRATVVPMRFGTVVGDESEIRALLLERRNELRELLAHVRGRVELGVRGGQPKASTGREYMRAKLEVERSLAPLAADARVRHKETAYLVERDLVGAFTERARGMDLSVSGPWPPYSFAGPLDG